MGDSLYNGHPSVVSSTCISCISNKMIKYFKTCSCNADVVKELLSEAVYKCTVYILLYQVQNTFTKAETQALYTVLLHASYYFDGHVQFVNMKCNIRNK